MKRYVALLLALFAIGWQDVAANGITISGTTVNQAAGTVTFNIRWYNSWRVNTVPNNWDAAWVFIKFRDCGAAPTTAWTHGLISTTLTDHNFGTDLEPTLSDGSAVGIDAAPNNTGAMLRRTAVGVYANAGPHSITLKVSNLPATGAIDVKVFAIEMVFIPQGAFLLSNDRYFLTAPASITTEAAQSITAHASFGGTFTLPAAFPKGYDPFYLMKYEITQGQYSEFLNTIPSTAQTNRFLGYFNQYRNRSSNGGTAPNTYFSDRPDRAQNYMTYRDLAAYLDWAALRPISDLEYVKACRGLGPVISGEYAWGNTTIIEENTITTPENGAETGVTTNSNANFSGSTTWITGGDGGQGPYRAGMFALPTADRTTAGAGYYGNMELSGNVWEMVVHITSTSATGFQRVWGDGNITAAGEHDVTGWPAASLTTTIDSWITIAGGSWGDGSAYLRITDREPAYYYINNWWNDAFLWDRASASAGTGGRGAR